MNAIRKVDFSFSKGHFADGGILTFATNCMLKCANNLNSAIANHKNFCIRDNVKSLTKWSLIRFLLFLLGPFSFIRKSREGRLWHKYTHVAQSKSHFDLNKTSSTALHLFEKGTGLSLRLGVKESDGAKRKKRRRA